MQYNSEDSIFAYNPGFIEKVKATELSVDLVQLRLESIRDLLDIGGDEDYDEFSKKESDEKEYIKSDSEEEYEIHDLKMIALR